MENKDLREARKTFRFSPAESAYIDRRAKTAGFKTTSAYARKMLINGIVVNYENSDLKKLRKSLGSIQKSMNQMAARVSSTDRMYKEDFDYLKEVLEDIWQQQNSIQSALLSILHLHT